MWFPEMFYTIDILFVLFVLFFAVRGVWNGLSGELAHVLTLLALLAGFCFFYPQLTELAENYWKLPENVLRFLVPTVLILAAVLVFVLLRALFKQMLKEKAGTNADKVGGVLVGILRGILLGLTVFVGLSMISNDSLYRVLSEKSSIGGWVCDTLTPWARPRFGELPALKKDMQKRIDGITQ
ncbi:MAG: CvpA family protein [Verrucomicrobia bacterium]|nr:CvpA family protein [Verrucomicrobiota bacterium]